MVLFDANSRMAMDSKRNKYSAQITQKKSQGASQAMLYATGLTDEDLEKPQSRHFERLV